MSEEVIPEQDWAYVIRVRATMTALDYRPLHRITRQLDALSQLLKYAALITGPLPSLQRYSPYDAAAAIWDSKPPQHRVESMTEASPLVVDIAMWHVTAVGFVTVVRQLQTPRGWTEDGVNAASYDVRRDRAAYLREQLSDLAPGLTTHPVTVEALERLISQTVDAVDEVYEVEELPGHYAEVQERSGK